MGLPWRKNSCAFDALCDCLLVIHLNLNEEVKLMFNARFPGFGELFEEFHIGRISNIDAKKQLEELLHKELWRTGMHQEYGRMRQHNAESTEMAWTVLLKTMCGANDNPLDALPQAVVATKFTQVDICRRCHHEHPHNVISSRTSIMNESISHLVTQNADEVLLKCLVGANAGSVRDCEVCGGWCDATAKNIDPARLLHIDGTYGFTADRLRSEVGASTIPEIVHLGEQSFNLGAITFGGENHFTCIVKNRFRGVDTMLFADGMKNNGRFVPINLTSFPFVYQGKRVTDLFYLRQDSYQCGNVVLPLS